MVFKGELSNAGSSAAGTPLSKLEWPKGTGINEIGDIIEIRRPNPKGSCTREQVSAFISPCFRGDSGAHCVLGDLIDMGRKGLVDASKGKRFVIIGEDHPRGYPLRLLEPLMDSGDFKGIFLEALERGNYTRAGLLDVVKGATVYLWNQEKYNLIIQTALSKGMEVYGIDVPLPVGCKPLRDVEYHAERTASWANYIGAVAAPGSGYLVLVGDKHLDFVCEPLRHLNLPVWLFGAGIRPEETLIISSNRHPARAADPSERDRGCLRR